MSLTLRATVKRGFVLFVIGLLFSLPLNLLQVQRHVNLFPSFFHHEELFQLSSWWTSVLCGLIAVTIGLMYPYLDEILSKSQSHCFQPPHCYHENVYCQQIHDKHYIHNTPFHQTREWSSVMKCIAIFVGINHASAKINFSSNFQLSLILLVLSIGLWYLFDGSKAGFILTSSVSLIASLTTNLLLYHGVYSVPYPDSTYLQSWLPCLFFSGSITIGNIGRQLAQYDVTCSCKSPFISHLKDSQTKEHID